MGRLVLVRGPAGLEVFCQDRLLEVENVAGGGKVSSVER